MVRMALEPPRAGFQGGQEMTIHSQCQRANIAADLTQDTSKFLHSSTACSSGESIRPRVLFQRLARLWVGIVLTGFAAGCEDGGFYAPDGTGTVRFAVIGVAPGATSAGTALITGNEMPEVTLNLPGGGVGQETVPVGTYHVAYTPPIGYTMAAGELDEFDLTVIRDEIIDIQVAVIPAVGTLDVSVSGFPAGAGNRGTAAILRTDVAGQQPTTLNISAPTTSASLVPGTYRITYFAPSGYELTPGQNNPQTVAVGTGATATASFNVAAVEGTGTLSISVTGFGSGSNLGTAVILRTDIPGQSGTTINITDAPENLMVVPGSYRVTYTPPAGYALAPGQTNPRNVVVTADATTTAAFDVQTLPTGTLQITVSGFPSGTNGRGSAAILRVDISGQSETNVDLTGATTSFALVPGSYRATYYPPSGYDLTAGQTNPITVTVSANDTVAATFAVEAASSQSGVVFHSDWSTTRGTSAAALLDTGKPWPWDLEIGNGNANEVIPSTGLGFPSGMANVLKAGLEYNGNGAPTQLLRIDNFGPHLPIPNVGSSLYYRWYIRIELPDEYTVDTNTHPIQDGNAVSDCNWYLRIQGRGDGTYIGRFNVNNSNAYPDGIFTPPPLPKNQTFRYELQIHRTGSNTFNMHARVYDSSNLLVYDDADFANQDGTRTLADNPTLTFHNLANLGGLNVGHNGVYGAGQSDLFPFIHSYQGGICVRTDGWCGPYSGGI
jgi:hypothetical protein